MEGIVSERQRRRLVQVATWLVGNRSGFENDAVRFDLVIVQPWQRPRHIEDAWRADD
jgi:Holliday junction resolvase-like predicted endonuclease